MNRASVVISLLLIYFGLLRFFFPVWKQCCNNSALDWDQIKQITVLKSSLCSNSSLCVFVHCISFSSSLYSSLILCFALLVLFYHSFSPVPPVRRLVDILSAGEVFRMNVTCKVTLSNHYSAERLREALMLTGPEDLKASPQKSVDYSVCGLLSSHSSHMSLQLLLIQASPSKITL